MELGFVRVCAAVPKLLVASPSFNVEKITELMSKAEDSSVICFPELCITSYTCSDLFVQKKLIDEALIGLSKILELSLTVNSVVIVGMPIKNEDKLFNCAVAIQKGKILGIVPKTFLPNNNEFYEKRWFSSAVNANFNTLEILGQEALFGTDIIFKSRDFSFAIELCEDLWSPIPPSSYHSLNGADIIFNLSASNELVLKHNYRKQLIAQQSARCVCGYVYASCGVFESTTDVVYAGSSIIAENGAILKENERFLRDSNLIVSEIDIDSIKTDRQKNINFNYNNSLKYRKVTFENLNNNCEPNNRIYNMHPFVPSDKACISERCEEIFSIQVAGLAKRIEHTKSDSCVIGVSGGLDSTLALLVTTFAFDLLKKDRKNITAVTMPGFGTTKRTFENAKLLMEKLCVTIKEIDIKPACLLHFKDIGHNESVHNTTYENVQARERTQILMDIANMTNGLVIGTGDLSELALGFATYNGDHMSMYAVNCSVPKTLVRYLISYAMEKLENKQIKAVLLDVLNTPVSPELLPNSFELQCNQITENIVGPYELCDFFLFYFLRYCYTPQKILYLAKKAFDGKYENEEILKWLKLFYKRFFANQFKRSCMPDGPKVGSVCLSPRGDFRMPSDAEVLDFIKELE